MVKISYKAKMNNTKLSDFEVEEELETIPYWEDWVAWRDKYGDE